MTPSSSDQKEIERAVANHSERLRQFAPWLAANLQLHRIDEDSEIAKHVADIAWRAWVAGQRFERDNPVK